MAKREKDWIGSPIVIKKKFVKIGGSACVIIPDEYMKSHGLEIGDEFLLIANRDIRISPDPHTEKEIYGHVTKIVNNANVTRKENLLRYIRSLKPDEDLANSIEEAMTETRKHKLRDVRL